MSGLRSAVSFLTRIPVSFFGGTPADMAGATRWVPVVGALVGLAVAGLYAAATLALPPAVAAAVAIGGGVLLTGAFHEDGLADTMDAVGGASSRDDALRIIRDPRHGTFGVMAIVVSVLIRVAALASLAWIEAVAALPVAHALSRGMALGALALVKPATEVGLGAGYRKTMEPGDTLVAIGSAVIIAVAAFGPWAPVAVVAGGLAGASASWPAVRKLGGITGDVVGAVQQAGEVAVLVMASAISAQGWWSVPWWR